MKTSPTIGELTKALVKAQMAMGPALKDSSNPFYKSKYADLTSVWNACQKPLNENGLMVTGGTEAGELSDVVSLRLCHVSGEWIESSCTSRPEKAGIQAFGSTISYLRRYMLSLIAGVVTEDDDGEAAMVRPAQGQAYQAPKTYYKPAAKLAPGYESYEEDVDLPKTPMGQVDKKTGGTVQPEPKTVYKNNNPKMPGF